MISKEEILKLAELSRIELKEEEIEPLQKDISNILEYVKQIEAAGGIQESGKQKEVGLNHNVMREDIPYGEDAHLKAAREDVVAAFPVQKNGYNVVRKIIQKDE